MLSSFILCALSLHGIMRSATAVPITAASVASTGELQGQPLFSRREIVGHDGAFPSPIVRRTVGQDALAEHFKRPLTTREEGGVIVLETPKAKDGKPAHGKRDVYDGGDLQSASQVASHAGGGKKTTKRGDGDELPSKTDTEPSDQDETEDADDKTGEDTQDAAKLAGDSMNPNKSGSQKADGQSGTNLGRRDGANGPNDKPKDKSHGQEAHQKGDGKAGHDAGNAAKGIANPKATNSSPPQKEDGKPGDKGANLPKRDGGNAPTNGTPESSGQSGGTNQGPIPNQRGHGRYKRQEDEAAKDDDDDDAQSESEQSIKPE